jgi:hypothetical protein
MVLSIMKLTNENMSVYIGGQVEILGTRPDGGDEYRYRGQIKNITLSGDQINANQDVELHLDFEYICQWNNKEGYEPAENRPYDISLCLFSSSDIGDGRICLNSPILNEMAVFYPPNHHKKILANGDVEKDESW